MNSNVLNYFTLNTPGQQDGAGPFAIEEWRKKSTQKQVKHTKLQFPIRYCKKIVMTNNAKFAIFCGLEFVAKLSDPVNIPTVRWNTDNCLK